MKNITKIEDTNYKAWVGKKDGKIRALKIGATWCMPCKQLEAMLPMLVEEFPKIQWGLVTLDDCPEIQKHFDVMGVPLILFFKNGERIGRLDGFYGKETVNRIRQIVGDGE